MLLTKLSRCSSLKLWFPREGLPTVQGCVETGKGWGTAAQGRKRQGGGRVCRAPRGARVHGRSGKGEGGCASDSFSAMRGCIYGSGEREEVLQTSFPLCGAVDVEQWRGTRGGGG